MRLETCADNAENERVKREYLIYLKAAKGLSVRCGMPFRT
jgi:hypothetical protein